MHWAVKMSWGGILRIQNTAMVKAVNVIDDRPMATPNVRLGRLKETTYNFASATLIQRNGTRGLKNSTIIEILILLFLHVLDNCR